MSTEALKTLIQDEMKLAMRAQDKPRLAIIRLMLAAIKQIEVDERKELTDPEVLSLLDKMIKQRRESIKQYEIGKRDDLIGQEVFEIEIIQTFLPEPLSETEITALIDEAITSINPTGIQDMGKVIGVIRPKVQGRADMGKVSQMVKYALTNN